MRRRREKLRSDIPIKADCADVGQPALQIGPDLAAHIGPAAAEAEIFAEIRPCRLVDHAIEKRIAPFASAQRVILPVLVAVTELGVPLDHAEQRAPADHQKAAPAITDPGESVADVDALRIRKLDQVSESCGFERPLLSLGERRHLFPVDALDRIDAGSDVGVEVHKPEHLLRFEANIGVDKDQMRGGLIGQKVREYVLPDAGDQGVSAQQPDLQPDLAPRARHLQLQQRADVDVGHEPAETRCTHNQTRPAGRRAVAGIVFPPGGFRIHKTHCTSMCPQTAGGQPAVFAANAPSVESAFFPSPPQTPAAPSGRRTATSPPRNTRPD